MVKMRALTATVALTFGCAGVPVHHGERSQTFSRELLEADRAFARVSREKGPSWAFADAMDPIDGRVFRPGEIIRGREAIEKMPFSKEGRLEWEPTGAEAAASGDFGVTWGRWTFVSPAGETRATGAYVTVWRRDVEGRWRGLIDIGNPDPTAH